MMILMIGPYSGFVGNSRFCRCDYFQYFRSGYAKMEKLMDFQHFLAQIYHDSEMIDIFIAILYWNISQLTWVEIYINIQAFVHVNR